MRALVAVAAAVLAVTALICTASRQDRLAVLAAVDEWKSALTSSDVGSLNRLYSVNPPARFVGSDKKLSSDIAPETSFWQGILAEGAREFEVNVISQKDQPHQHVLSLQISMKVQTPKGPRTRYVIEQQAWQQQGDQWRITLAAHSELLKMQPALQPNPNLYDKDADPRAEIARALIHASKGHQHVILVFGANWCYDCHVLDQAFHEGEDGKKNSDLAAQYKVNLDRGIPAVAVLSADGKVLYSQRNGEWESARSLDPDDVIAFLTQWKP